MVKAKTKPSRLFFLQQRLPFGNFYIAEMKAPTKERAETKFRERYGSFPGFAVWEIGPIPGGVELTQDYLIREITLPKIKQKAKVNRGY